MSEELPRLPGFREAALRRRRETVGALADHRRAAGLSQTEIAARMGTSQSTVARLEAGDVDPRMSTLERYAEALGGRLDVSLHFDPAPAIPPGLPLLRPAYAPGSPLAPPGPAAPLAPAAAMPGSPVAPLAPAAAMPGGPGAPFLPAAQVSPAHGPGGAAPEGEDPAPGSPASERPYAAPLPPPGGDRPARPTQRRW
ncbi:helix-turn-helix domain-containing protein [Cryptosporangium sp. NPDC048952]|uniref:helix-turn-helix domain-containing protein n=1 Tax=Cryptosporangium sp. NPDC048952 TaxID=3363961 RepID=UPI003719FF37